jgi:hypothetical protein
MSRRALIFSSSADAANFGRVARALRRSGMTVVELLSDEVLSGSSQLCLEFVDEGYRLSVDGEPSFDLSQVGAAWWRKPQWAQVVRPDAAQRISLELELERAHLAIAGLVPEDAWLNSPDAMRRAESKLRQLQVAASLGFRCPRTLVTNDWAAARRTFSSERVVFKAFRGGIRSEGEDRVVFTQRLDPAAFESGTALPYPGLIQEEIPRAREWRVTVVGSTLFPVAVYAPDGGVDWRRDQLRGLARFVSEKLDRAAEAALVSLVSQLGLRYAAVDLIEEPDGTLVFLEANPNGQYAWLEESLDMPISAAIARTLGAREEGRADNSPSRVS